MEPSVVRPPPLPSPPTTPPPPHNSPPLAPPSFSSVDPRAYWGNITDSALLFCAPGRGEGMTNGGMTPEGAVVFT